MPPAKKPAALAAFTLNEEAVRVMLTAVGDAVDDKLADIKETLDKTEESIHRIMEALTGNGLGTNHGLIWRVGDVESKLGTLRTDFQTERQERRDAAARVKYTALGVGIGAGLGGGGLVLAVFKVLGG